MGQPQDSWQLTQCEARWAPDSFLFLFFLFLFFSKLSGGLESLISPALELFIFEGGATPIGLYSPVCCQAGKAMATHGRALCQLKAFSWRVAYMAEHKQAYESQPHSSADCSGTSAQALDNLWNSSTLLAAAGITFADDRRSWPLTSVLAVPQHLKALTLKASTGDAMRGIILDTTVAHKLRWLMILRWLQASNAALTEARVKHPPLSARLRATPPCRAVPAHGDRGTRSLFAQDVVSRGDSVRVCKMRCFGLHSNASAPASPSSS